MKILIVGDLLYREKIINKLVSCNVTCRDNFVETETVNEATTFLIKQVLGQSVKQHIDLIIVDDDTQYNRHHLNLCEWVRKVNQSFSGGNFRLSSIPIVLCKNGVSYNEENCSPYNAILPFSEDDKDMRIVDVSNKLVKLWRQNVLGDLETLKIDVKVLNQFGETFKSFFSQYIKIANDFEYYFSLTTVLSKNFIRMPKSLNYDWLSEQKVLQVEQSLENYNKIIKNLIKYNGRAFEKQVLHKFYDENEFFLTRDTYAYQEREKRYYVSATSKYHIPDYILKSPFPGYTTSSISEIKKHNIFFEFDPKRHRPFTNYSSSALFQASGYQDDFKTAGLLDSKFRMDLIIGLEDKLTDLIRRKIEKHFATINVTTHDDLLMKVERFYKRLRLLHTEIK